MQYSPKYTHCTQYTHCLITLFYKTPIILGGDFNIDLKSTNGQEFILFMRNTFCLELNTSSNISTTRNNTTVVALFTRHIEDITTMNYISYFSYHEP